MFYFAVVNIIVILYIYIYIYIKITNLDPSVFCRGSALKLSRQKTLGSRLKDNIINININLYIPNIKNNCRDLKNTTIVTKHLVYIDRSLASVKEWNTSEIGTHGNFNGLALSFYRNLDTGFFLSRLTTTSASALFCIFTGVKQLKTLFKKSVVK